MMNPNEFALMWLIVALISALATVLALVGYAACAVGGASDAQLDEGEYADTTRDSV